MPVSSGTFASTQSEPHETPLEKMPGHWLLAKLGKRVLRPGGLELTRKMLRELKISPDDDVVEFAPGLGVTAQMILSCRPKSYTAVERDSAAAETVSMYLSGSNQRCIQGSAEGTDLPDGVASVVYGEAMLSMQPATTKSRIVTESARLLRPSGRYGVHELCIVPNDIPKMIRDEIATDLGSEIHAGIRPLTESQWRELLNSAGLQVTERFIAPMHLLQPWRVVRDEGLPRALKFAWNVLRNRAGRQRVLSMHRSFRKHRKHLMAIALVATKPTEV